MVDWFGRNVPLASSESMVNPSPQTLHGGNTPGVIVGLTLGGFVPTDGGIADGVGVGDEVGGKGDGGGVKNSVMVLNGLFGPGVMGSHGKPGLLLKQVAIGAGAVVQWWRCW